VLKTAPTADRRIFAAVFMSTTRNQTNRKKSMPIRLTLLLNQAGARTPAKQNEATTGFGSGRWLGINS
jgi:hypothetical protein